MATPEQPQPTKLLLAAMINGRSEATLMFAASMLRLQTDVLTNPSMPLHCDVAFVDCLDDALNAALREGHDAVVAIDSFVSFPAAFVARFLSSGLDLVAAPHPVPGVMDWARIAKHAPGDAEAVEFAGNVYAPAAPRRPLRDDYWVCDKDLAGTKKLMCVGVRRKVIETAARAAPELEGGRKALCVPRVTGASQRSADETFLDACGADLVVDRGSPVGVMGPIAFHGRVVDKESIR